MNKKINFALILMGFTSLVVQTQLIRELLITFYGTELIIGIILANWIMLEAFGSMIASGSSPKAKNPFLAYALLQLGIVIYLPFSIFFIRTAKNMLGLAAGEGTGILAVFFSSFFIIAPLSLLDGAQFPFGCRILSETKNRLREAAGRVYVLEAVGFILAGPLFTYILITKLNSFAIVCLLGTLNLFSAILLLKEKMAGSFAKAIFITANLLLILAFICFFGPAEKMHKLSISKQWRQSEVMDYRNSIYGNLVVTKIKNQYNFFSDGIPIITTPHPDIMRIEELAHFSMLSVLEPKNVLLLSGGPGGLINEVLKYPIKNLTYCEIDPLLIKLIKSFPTDLTLHELNDKRLQIQYLDAKRFIRLVKYEYDVAILNLPMPSTLQLNRFYSREFFQDVRSVLSEKGVFCLSLPGSLTYLNEEMLNLNSSILNTLRDLFYVNFIPGDVNLYLCAKNEFKINPDIFLERLKMQNIQTKLLNKAHLQFRLNPIQQEWLNNALLGYRNTRKNSDLLPAATFYSISYWNKVFSARTQKIFRLLDKLNFGMLLSLLLVIGLFLLILQKSIKKLKKSAVGFGIFSSGFAGMSFQLILIYTYQSFYGFVFSQIAILVTAFMAGLALGGWLVTGKLKEIKNELLTFIRIESVIIGFYLIATPLLLYLNRSYLLSLSWVFFILSCASGCLVGLEFPLANKIYAQEKKESKTAGILYALDLAGAWMSALVTSVALVPIIGIPKTCLLLVTLKVISLLLVANQKG